MNEQQNNQKLDQRLASLSRSIAPESDLWPAIEQRINADTQQLAADADVSHRSDQNNQNSRGLGGWWAVAAGVLMLVGASQVFLSGVLDQNGSADEILIANANLELQALDQMFSNPQSTSDLLIASMPQGGWRVVPTSTSAAAIQIWQPALMAGLQENQQAIASLRAALQQQPQQTSLLQQLARAERRQHRLLRQWVGFNVSGVAGILITNTTIFSGDQHV